MTSCRALPAAPAHRARGGRSALGAQRALERGRRSARPVCALAEGLLGPGMAPFQGPALLVFNDSCFSDADFESISRIGDSVKRGQAGKTGRFG